MKSSIRILLVILWMVCLFYCSNTSESGKICGFILCVIMGTVIQLDNIYIQDLKKLFKRK
jgi:hypothetical protein